MKRIFQDRSSRVSAGLLAVSLLAALGFADRSDAALIASGGTTFNATDWVDQGFGGFGYIFFNSNVAAISSNIALSGADINYAKLSSHSVGAGGQTGINAPVPIQNTAGTATDLSVGYWRDQGTDENTFGDLIRFDLINTPSVLRIGVLVGAGGQSDPEANPRDYPSDIRLSDGTNMFDHVVTRPGPAEAYQADWYFFDVTGITSTTQLTVFATGQSSVSPNLNTPISGVVFAIPEPSSAAFCLFALGGLALRRRR